MDQRCRGNNQHDSPRISHGSYPSRSSHGAGHMDPEFRRLQHGYIRNNYTHNLHNHHPHSHPRDLHEALQREIEKERIREEIIMSEIVRRRALEAEVRRELMMEREMTLRRGNDGTPYGSPPVMRLESPMRSSLLGTRAEGWYADERLFMALEDKEKQKGGHENGGLDASPYQRRSADVKILEVKPASEGNSERERIILMIKPGENVSGSKRKAVTPPEELPADIIANKKSKEEWSCALCQVSATSKKSLEDHVLGKKHKSKQAALIAQRGGKNHSIGLFSSKATKSNGNIATIDPGEEEKVKHKAQSLLSEKAGEATSKEDDLPLLENPKPECSKKTQSEVIQEVKKNEDDPKKKGYTFWCNMCLVGTLSRRTMNNHKMGKKHRSRLRRCEQNGGTGSVNQKKSDALAECVEEPSENGKNINSVNFDQALDQASSKVDLLLDEFDHRGQGGGTLNSENINKALDEKRSGDHELLDIVEEEDHKQVDIIKEEIADVEIAKPVGDSK